MFDPNQRRLLALDGGGIMGVLSLEILKRMEDQLRPYSGLGDKFVLADFFDYFGGTSTGAIIAAGLAMGRRVDELIEFYETCGPAMFAPAPFYRQLRYRYLHQPLADKLKQVIGEGSIAELQDKGLLRKLLLVVTRNAGTDSAWPISTNPAAYYNDPARPDCNLNIPLWQLVRASTAAPVYFSPEVIKFGDRERPFVDGGITPFNNPALLLFKMAVMPQYRLGWEMGERKLMLVSVGTGFAKSEQEVVKVQRRTLVGTAATVPGELMRGIAIENDANCRILGRCVNGGRLDSELGSLVPDYPLAQDLGRAFLYARYDADLSRQALTANGLGGIDADSLTIDNVKAIGDLRRIGRFAANQVDMPRQFATFMGAAAPAATP